MAKWKITFDRDVCIGVLSCVAVADKFWKEADGEAKVDLAGAELNKETGLWELVVESDDYPLAKESAEVCPVEAIKVEKIE
ncbi:ferredoxin [Nanoarchaeota archaeon]